MSTAKTLSIGQRMHNYVTQNEGRQVTPRQSRRLMQKANRNAHRIIATALKTERQYP